jgi:RimJ/RimL family protein N-acetyltransferase
MGEEVRLREVEAADLEVFFEHQRDEEAARTANFPSRDRERFMAHWTTRVLGDPDAFARTVTVDGEPAGNVVAWWQEGRRFVGYWFGREWWGRGIGTRALGLFLERERHRPLYADPHAGNTASIRLLERCGFRAAGTVWYDGQEHRMLVLDGPGEEPEQA